MAKILAFAGSLSKDSVNKKLIKATIPQLEKLGHEVTLIDLINFPLPVYSPDLVGNDFPEQATKIAKLMLEHPVWLISSAENNYSMPACVKNLIDWLSRTPDNKPNLAAFANRIIALMSASPSTYGGSRGLRPLREMLTALGCLVIPAQVCLSGAYAAFDEQGNLIDVMGSKAVADTVAQLDKIASKLL